MNCNSNGVQEGLLIGIAVAAVAVKENLSASCRAGWAYAKNHVADKTAVINNFFILLYCYGDTVGYPECRGERRNIRPDIAVCPVGTAVPEQIRYERFLAR